MLIRVARNRAQYTCLLLAALYQLVVATTNTTTGNGVQTPIFLSKSAESPLLRLSKLRTLQGTSEQNKHLAVSSSALAIWCTIYFFDPWPRTRGFGGFASISSQIACAARASHTILTFSVNISGY